MSKVSVIIPVFNKEKYLSTCINSIINQSLKDIELILIDDCSSDNSYTIMEEYAKKDSRIKIYKNSNNIGAGATRNKGIKIAKSDYISFVDADDYISQNLLEINYEAAVNNNADIIMNDIVFVKDDRFLKLPQVDKSNNLRQINDKKFEVKNISISPCNKLYKRELLSDIKFPENCKWEDIGFSIVAFLIAQRIFYIDNKGYFYRRNLEEGISGVNYKENNTVSDIIKVNDYIADELFKRELYREYLDEYSYVCTYSILQRVDEINNWPDSEKKVNCIRYLFDELKNRVCNLNNIDLDLLSSKVKQSTIDSYLEYIKNKVKTK